MDLLFRVVIYSLLVIGPLVLGLYLYRRNEKRKKIQWMESKKYIILHILVPKNNEKSPAAAEQMFASLHGIFKAEEKWQEQITFEIVSRDKFIHFYTHVPVHLKDFVEGQIYAQYPNVEISEVEDYSKGENIGIRTVGCELILNKQYAYPIKTFNSFEVDPLSAITSVLSKVDEHEQVWIQLIIRPVSDKWQDKGINFIENIRSGGGGISIGIPKLIFNTMSKLIMDFISIAVGRETAAEASDGTVKLTGPQEAALKGVEEKITKLGFDSKIRILINSLDEQKASAKCSVVGGAFKQFNTVNLNGFNTSKIIKGNEFLRLYQKREFTNSNYVLNIEELASIFHLPTTAVETPSIVWAGSKKGEPPSDLPIEGSVGVGEMSVFAKSDFRHMSHRFGIKTEDRRLHMYAIGKTGTGKSTMLENMIINDIKNGKGVAVVDPHGELISNIMDFIPNNRINDVIYFNPADRDWPIGFNVLENVDPELKNVVASGVVGIFKKIFGDSWGPRLEYILRNAILALLEYPDSTLLSVMKILIDKNFRKKVVEKVTDPIVKDFFVNEYDKWDQKFRLESIQSIQNKVGQFLSSETIRNIIGQPKSSFNIRGAMDESKILLINTSIGKIGEDSAALLGGMLITKIQLAAMQRADISQEQRVDFYLYVDEFQNFATESFATILSEARKYRLNLIMTNQYIAQMNEKVADAIFGNVGTTIAFRVGPTDSTFLQSAFEPIFEANDLVNLNNYNIYCKMAINGVTRPAFSAITLPPHKGKTGNAEKIINSSRERYCKSREFVEGKIIEWSKSFDEEDKKPIKRIDKQIEDYLIKSNKEEKASTVLDKSNNSKYQRANDNKGEIWYFGTGLDSDNNSDKKIVDKVGNVVYNKKEEVLDNEKINSTDNQEKVNKVIKNDIALKTKIQPKTDEIKSLLKPILERRIQKAKTTNNELISIDEINKFNIKENVDNAPESINNLGNKNNIQALNPDTVVHINE